MSDPSHSHSPLAASAASEAVTIRPAYADDEIAVRRLAALDSAPVPASPLLLAEVDGQLRVALSVADDALIADPFELTADLQALVRARAVALRARRRQTAGRRARRSLRFA